MNTYVKFCPNVWIAKCDAPHEKGDHIFIQTKYEKENECIVHNLIGKKNECWYYSITRADGFSHREWVERKKEKLEYSAERYMQKSDHYYERSNKDQDFLSLGEPIKVGHHSERRHRRMISQAQENASKFVENREKSQELSKRAEAWASHVDDVNLSMPESLEYFRKKYEAAEKYHLEMKEGKIPRTHSYSLVYANNASKDMQKKLKLAEILWG